MQVEIGKVYDGKVTGVLKFGAFVEMEDGVSGMVHISEVANEYVNDINDHLQVGQEVKVKVISIAEDGKIALSIKKALPPVQRPAGKKPQNTGRPQKQPPMRNGGNDAVNAPYAASDMPKGPQSFEDMMSRFKKSSDEKLSDMKRNMEGKGRRGSRRK